MLFTVYTLRVEKTVCVVIYVVSNTCLQLYVQCNLKLQGFEIGSETYPADSLDNVTLTVLRSGKDLDRQTQVTVTASGTATGSYFKYCH